MLRGFIRGFGVLAATGAAVLAEAPREPHTYLRTIGFTDRQMAELDQGKVIARVLPEKDDYEASVMGAVRCPGGEDAFVEQYRKIESFRAGGHVLQIGRFGDPPQVADLQGLTLDQKDVEELRKCRPGNCEFKIGPRGLRVIEAVDWSAVDAHAVATARVKEAMVALTRLYLDQGSAAMAVYTDKNVPVSAATETEAILRNSPNLLRYNPEMHRYLLDFPKASLSNSESFCYWLKEKVRDPVVSVAQVTIQKTSQDRQTAYFIASKHIYDSHYFLARLDFLTLIGDTSDQNGFYLLHSVRARIDPPSKLRGFLLGKIKDGMKDALVVDLTNLKRRLETGP